MKEVFTLILFLLASIAAIPQSITKLTPPAVSGTVCPSAATYYEVSVPSNLTSCKINWTATNGLVTQDQYDQRKATVVWNDTPGASGTITATFTNCSNESNNGTTASKTELILSVKNQAWGSYVTSINVDYCTKSQVLVTVPHMYVQGTGGIAQPPLTEVTYYWTIPSGTDGWREVGSHNTGSFGTSTNSILIEPINCSKPGVVTVYGTLLGIFCNSEKSATATISLNGANPVATVGPQTGYMGGSACDTTPVTFYVTPSVALGCISGYNWTYPPSWTLVSQSGNSITLRPSGNPVDSDPINATINFTCGSSITSGDYEPPFNAPEISLGTSTAICSEGKSVTLINPGPNAQVNWVPSSNMVVSSGQGTPTAIIKAINASTSGEGTLNVTLASCPSVSVPSKSVWVGKPKVLNDSGLPTSITMQGNTAYDRNPLPCIPHYNYNYAHYLEVSGEDFSKIKGRESVSWTGSYVSHSLGLNGRGIHFMPNSYTGPMHGSGYVQLMASNTCGTASIVAQGYGACSSFYAVYPNPSSTEINIEQIIPSESSAQLNGESKPDQKTDSDFEVLLMNISNVEMLRGNSGNGKLKLDVSSLKKGVYVMHIISKGKRETTTIKIE